MLRHIVLVRFRPEVGADTKHDLFEALRGLQNRLPGLSGFHVGSNVSVETDLIRGNTDAFWVDFADEAARDAYLADPEHRSIGARIVALCEGGIDGITVADIQV